MFLNKMDKIDISMTLNENKNRLKSLNVYRDNVLKDGCDINELSNIDSVIFDVKNKIDYYENLLKLVSDKNNDKCTCNSYAEGCSCKSCSSNDYTVKDNKMYYISDVKHKKFEFNFPVDINILPDEVKSVKLGKYFQSLYRDGKNISIKLIDKDRIGSCIPYSLTNLISDKKSFNLLVNKYNAEGKILYSMKICDIVLFSLEENELSNDNSSLMEYKVEGNYSKIDYYSTNNYETADKK